MTRAGLKSNLCVAVASAAVLVGRQATAQTAIPPPAPEFAIGVAQADEFEIQAANDAVAQTQNPRIRAFAQQMIDDHTRSGETLRQATSASGLPAPPPAMNGDQARMLSSLQSLRGPDFDQTYAHQQVLAHRQALALVRSYASAGPDPNLRRVAESAAPMIQHHLEMAEQIRTAVGGS